MKNRNLKNQEKNMEGILSHSDDGTMDEHFVHLFDRIVSSAVLIENTTISQGFNHAELERTIDDAFEELKLMYGSGWRFNQRRYTQYVIQRINERGDDQDITDIFFPFCHFMTMIEALEECPNITKRFKEHKWNELTNLYVNRSTFRDLAENFLEGVERLFDSDPEAVDLDVAKKANATSMLFMIPLSSHLLGRINFITCNSPDEYVANHWEPPTENTQLQ